MNKKFFIIILLSCIAQALEEKKTLKTGTFPVISFGLGMRNNYNYDSVFAEKNKEWNQLRGLYNSYLENIKISSTPRIPKIIHVIWLGSPLPARCKLLIDTWRHYHKDWEFKFWTDKDVKPFGLKNQVHFDKAVNWGEKSDIFRYEILYRYGGVYIDTDFKCLRSFDILNETCDFYAGIAYNHTALLYNGLIGAAPGHPILKACIDNMKMEGDLRNFDAIMERTGPDFFTRMFFKALPDCPKASVVPLPTSYFYPFPPRFRKKSNDRYLNAKYTHPWSFCVHYFAASWAK